MCVYTQRENRTSRESENKSIRDHKNQHCSFFNQENTTDRQNQSPNPSEFQTMGIQRLQQKIKNRETETETEVRKIE